MIIQSACGQGNKIFSLCRISLLGTAALEIVSENWKYACSRKMRRRDKWIIFRMFHLVYFYIVNKIYFVLSYSRFWFLQQFVRKLEAWLIERLNFAALSCTDDFIDCWPVSATTLENLSMCVCVSVYKFFLYTFS